MSALIDQWNANFKKLTDEDDEAKANGNLVGRYIEHPYADGRAFYRITKRTARTVTIEVVTGIGDDWVLPAWGKKTTLPLKTAQQFVAKRDQFERIFRF